MASKWYSVVIDCHDPAALADFWSKALGYPVVSSEDEEVVLAKEKTWPDLVFGTVPEGKLGKNRLHIDLNPDDQQAEVDRLIGLGATRIDIGQGERPMGRSRRPRRQRVLRTDHTPRAALASAQSILTCWVTAGSR